jgi:predicted Kef-type K+ transport protein
VTHDLPVLRELVLLAGCSLAIILLFRRVRCRPVVGFLVTGILLGPGGFGPGPGPRPRSPTLAEIGVVLLLFTVGLEFSIADLKKLGVRAAPRACSRSSGRAVVARRPHLVAGRASARGRSSSGLLLAPSSTALVFRLITDRGELQAPHGRLITAILLVQDLAVVPDGDDGADARRVDERPAPRPSRPRRTRCAARPLLAVVVVAFLVLREVAPWLARRAPRADARARRSSPRSSWSRWARRSCPSRRDCRSRSARSSRDSSSPSPSCARR